MKALPSGGCRFGPVDLAQHGVCQSITPANDLEPSAPLPEPFSFQTQEGAQKPENTLHLGSRTAPVVGGEGVYRETVDSYVRCALHGAPQCGHSGPMASDAGQSAPHRPAAFAVHNDGHVQPI